MNVRKNIDYSALFAAVDKAVRATLPQMKLYWEIGRLVCERPEKGAAVAVAEHLQTEFPDAKGFSPRNVRRMREFYRSYTETSALLAEAMCLGWTQNVVILEADLPLTERAWYIHAALQNGWSKLTLAENIDRCTHNKDIALDTEEDPCYTAFEEKHLKDCADRSASRQPQKYLQNSARPTQAGRAQHRLRRKDSPSADVQGLYPIRLYDRNRRGKPPGHTPPLRRRPERKAPSAVGIRRAFGFQSRRPVVHPRFRSDLARC